MAVHVHFNSWYISLQLYFANQQSEMTEFCVVCRTANFFKIYARFSCGIAVTVINRAS